MNIRVPSNIKHWKYVLNQPAKFVLKERLREAINVFVTYIKRSWFVYYLNELKCLIISTIKVGYNKINRIFMPNFDGVQGVTTVESTFD